jgi:hypothetical protein
MGRLKAATREYGDAVACLKLYGDDACRERHVLGALVFARDSTFTGESIHRHINATMWSFIL